MNEFNLFYLTFVEHFFSVQNALWSSQVMTGFSNSARWRVTYENPEWNNAQQKYKQKSMKI